MSYRFMLTNLTRKGFPARTRACPITSKCPFSESGVLMCLGSSGSLMPGAVAVLVGFMSAAASLPGLHIARELVFAVQRAEKARASKLLEKDEKLFSSLAGIHVFVSFLFLTSCREGFFLIFSYLRWRTRHEKPEIRMNSFFASTKPFSKWLGGGFFGPLQFPRP